VAREWPIAAGSGDRREIVEDKDEVRASLRDIGATRHRDTRVGRGKRDRIVDPVADERDRRTRMDFAHEFRLRRRCHAMTHSRGRYRQFEPDPRDRRCSVAARDPLLDPLLPQRGDRGDRRCAQRILKFDRACKHAVDRHARRRLPVDIDRTPAPGQRRGVHPRGASDRDRRATSTNHHDTANPFTGNRDELLRRADSEAELAGVRDDAAGHGMLARRFDACRGLEQRRHIAPGRRHDADDSRLALGDGPGLVEDDRTHARELLEGRRGSEEDPALRGPSRGDHHGHRRRQSERARARHDEHADERLERALMAQRGRPVRRREHEPRREGPEGDQQDRRNEHRRHSVGRTRDARLGGLRLVDHRDHPRKHGVGGRTRRHDIECADRIERARRDGIARTPDDRHRLAGQHRLVDLARTHDHRSVDRHPFAWPDPHAHARLDLLGADRALVLGPSEDLDHPHRRHRQRAERPHRLAGPLRGARLEQATDQHEDEDDRRRLEPEVRRVLGMREVSREQRPCACRERDGRPERDERVHVGSHGAQAREGRAMDRPSAPEEDRGRERELRPRRALSGKPGHRAMRHGDRGERQRQCDADDDARAKRTELIEFALRAHGGIAREVEGKACIAHALGEGRKVRTTAIESDARAARCERDIRGHHRAIRAKRLLDLRRAGGAMHAVDRNDAHRRRRLSRGRINGVRPTLGSRHVHHLTSCSSRTFTAARGM